MRNWHPAASHSLSQQWPSTAHSKSATLAGPALAFVIAAQPLVITLANLSEVRLCLPGPCLLAAAAAARPTAVLLRVGMRRGEWLGLGGGDSSRAGARACSLSCSGAISKFFRFSSRRHTEHYGPERRCTTESARCHSVRGRRGGEGCLHVNSHAHVDSDCTTSRAAPPLRVHEPLLDACPVVSHWRDCHFADALSPSLLKQLLKGERGAAE